MRITIFKYLRDPKTYKILGKDTLRIINVHKTFIGIDNDTLNQSEIARLTKDLEPNSDGYTLN